ncbi:DNA replication complex GINS family protein [Candidatus Woesearchaeota archaeon]|nr:DNA replication complex GINS family protein [Candidatus Woesearchaeota archaeon]
MVDIRITYETLFDLLRREKNREELQGLDKDFYEQVLAYLKEKKEAITKKGDELFASAEREKLKIQFQNIRRIIKELYERREKKIISIAMSKARTGSDIIDTSALLPSERKYFDEQVDLFVKYKEKVLNAMLEVREFDDKNLGDGQAQPGAGPRGNEAHEDNLPDAAPEAAFSTASSLAQSPCPGDDSKDEDDSKGNAGPKANPGPKDKAKDLAKAETKTIRMLAPLPSFMGRDGSALGPFDEGEEIELDMAIAEVLIKRGSAEPC